MSMSPSRGRKRKNLGKEKTEHFEFSGGSGKQQNGGFWRKVGKLANLTFSGHQNTVFSKRSPNLTVRFWLQSLNVDVSISGWEAEIWSD